MRPRAIALAAACALSIARPVAADEDDDRRTHVYLTLGVTAAFLASETLLKSTLAPAECRWCEPPGFDADVREALLWDSPNRARLFSDLGAFVAAPLVAFGFTAVPLLVDGASGDELFESALPIVESVVLTQSIAQIVKFSVGRQRPFARFGGEPGSDPDDDNLSFFSGHSSFVFSAVTSAGVRAHQLGLRTAPLIWAVGIPLASTTAYLRIAGDKHYFSDVVVGSLAGVAIGVAVPLLFHPASRRDKARSSELTSVAGVAGGLVSLAGVLGVTDLSLVPTGNGAAFTGSF